MSKSLEQTVPGITAQVSSLVHRSYENPNIQQQLLRGSLEDNIVTVIIYENSGILKILENDTMEVIETKKALQDDLRKIVQTSINGILSFAL